MQQDQDGLEQSDDDGVDCGEDEEEDMEEQEDLHGDQDTAMENLKAEFEFLRTDNAMDSSIAGSISLFYNPKACH